MFSTYSDTDIFLLKVDDTCELFLATISHTSLQVLQLDLYLLIVSHGLFAFPPNKQSFK